MRWSSNRVREAATPCARTDPRALSFSPRPRHPPAGVLTTSPQAFAAVLGRPLLAPLDALVDAGCEAARSPHHCGGDPASFGDRYRGMRLSTRRGSDPRPAPFGPRATLFAGEVGLLSTRRLCAAACELLARHVTASERDPVLRSSLRVAFGAHRNRPCGRCRPCGRAAFRAGGAPLRLCRAIRSNRRLWRAAGSLRLDARLFEPHLGAGVVLQSL